jgi:ferredoxin-thioredoxin reductase catalytic chain
MDKEESSLRTKSEKYAKENGYQLNPNKKIVEGIIIGLLKNKEIKGELYCPCRLPTGNKEKDKEIICPCIFHKKEIEEMGHCHCFLFVSTKN